MVNKSLREKVSDRQNAESAVRESENRFREMVDCSPIPIAIYDLNGDAVLLNEKFVRTFGYTAEDIQNLEAWWPRAYPDPAYRQKVIDRWNEHVEKASRGSKEIEPLTERVTCKDGSVRYVNFAGAFVGNLIMVTVQDITERKQAEDALRESEARLQSIFRAAPTGIGLVVNRRIAEANALLCEMTGYTRDELVGHSARMLYPTQEDYDFVGREKYRQISETGTGTVETRWRRKDGQSIDILLSSTPLDQEKLDAGVTFTALDITERKQAEKALRDSEERLRLKLDSVLSPDVDLSEQELSNVIDTQALQQLMDDFYAVTGMGIGIIDLKGTVLVGAGWQEACTRFHRQCPESLKNCIESDLHLSRGVKKGEFRAYKCKNNMWDVVTPMFIGEKQVGNIFLGQFFYDDEVPDMSIFAAQAEWYGFDKDRYLAAIDSVPRWSREKVQSLMEFYARLADMISSLSYSNLKLARAMAERRRSEMALEHAKAQAELYVDLMSHDISNMNQAMMGYLELAELTIPMEPEQRQLIEKPIEIIKHSARMIDNVRKLERIRHGMRAGNVVDMCVILARVLEGFSEVKDRCVTINTRVPEACPVIADEMLKDVFSNIVENAVRHTSGAVTIDIAVDLLEAEGRRCYRVSIADNGPGIPDEQKRRVFTFLEGNKARSGRRGLGLCLVKTLVENFHGSVWIEDRVAGDYRKGAKFIVELPAAL